MKRLVLILAFGFVAWQWYVSHGSHHAANAVPEEVVADDAGVAPADRARDAVAPSQFKCDGRTYCSQMTSCAEATFFLQSCPGVKMDGNHDGVPCERQWCK